MPTTRRGGQRREGLDSHTHAHTHTHTLKRTSLLQFHAASVHPGLVVCACFSSEAAAAAFWFSLHNLACKFCNHRHQHHHHDRLPRKLESPWAKNASWACAWRFRTVSRAGVFVLVFAFVFRQYRPLHPTPFCYCVSFGAGLIGVRARRVSRCSLLERWRRPCARVVVDSGQPARYTVFSPRVDTALWLGREGGGFVKLGHLSPSLSPPLSLSSSRTPGNPVSRRAGRYWTERVLLSAVCHKAAFVTEVGS